MSKSALITGITGQDGSYLAELLLKKGYNVFGLIRRLSVPNRLNIKGIEDEISLLDGDLMDQSSLDAAIKEAAPDEVYNLASQASVPQSFTKPILTGQVTGLGVLRVLEAVRTHAPDARVYQASSSEMFGTVQVEPQSETTAFHPESPYGVAKVYGYWASVNYREAYGMFISNGILFDHISERQSLDAETRRISRGVGRIHMGLTDHIALESLDIIRDWGYAPEYVELMWRIVQHDRPEDFVGATGKGHSLRDFAREAFHVVGIYNWENYVSVEEEDIGPVPRLRGDATKAKELLGWQPKIQLRDIARRMVESDVKRAIADRRESHW